MQALSDNTPTKLADTVAGLLSGSPVRFATSLENLQTQELPPDYTATELFIGVIESLFSSSLRIQEQSRRLSLLALALERRWTLNWTALAAKAQVWPTPIRTALAATAPLNAKPLFYRHAEIASPGTIDQAELPNANDPGAARDEPPEMEDDRRNIVVICGTADIVSMREQFKAHGLTALRAENIDKLQRIKSSSDEICGFYFSQSFLENAGPESFYDVLGHTLAYSTFACIQVSSEGFGLDRARVAELARESRRGRDIPIDQLMIGDGRLDEGTLMCFARARRSLNVLSSTVFVPGNLTATERSVLASAIENYSTSERFGRKSKALSLKFVPGGRTEAKVAELRFDTEDEPPIIVKISKTTYILDEVGRYRRFISRWDRRLSPRVYFHSGVGIIFFSLVDNAQSHSVRAPVLEERLKILLQAQLYPGPCNGPAVTDIAAALRNAADKLSELNTQRPDSGDEVDWHSRPHLRPIEELERKEKGWRFSEAAVASRARAFERYMKFDRTAIIHGDVHMRNVLVRADREAAFIDYANAGPGHPAYDLVRLELALFLDGLRSTCDYGVLVEFQTALSTSSKNCGELAGLFPDLMTLDANVAIVAGCVAARDCTLNVLRSHGIDEAHYLDVKLLLAWESLIHSDLQQMHCRSVIDALSTYIS